CRRQRGGVELPRIPADPGEAFACPLWREICDRNQVYAGRMPYLGEEHRAKLAGPDQGNAQRLVLRSAAQQQTVKIHCKRIRAGALTLPQMAAVEQSQPAPARCGIPVRARVAPPTAGAGEYGCGSAAASVRRSVKPIVVAPGSLATVTSAAWSSSIRLAMA